MQLLKMQNFFSKATPLLGIAALGLAAAPAAHAQTTLTDTNTLNGTFFHDAAANIVSITQAQAYIASNTPTGTFTATQPVLTGPGYSGRDFSTPQSFLGSDGASYKGNTNTDLNDGIFDFKGYLDVTTPNTYTFSTGSDDGSALFIDGSEIVSNDFIAPERYRSGTDTLTAGLHPVELVYYNHTFNGGQGGANLNVDFGGLNLTTNDTPASAAPEPSAIAVWAFVGLGAAGLLLKARRRKAVAA